MTNAVTRRVVIGCAVVALAAGVILALSTLSFGAFALQSGLLGWGLMALVGVTAGGWAVSRHGTPGPGFIVAVGTGMLARLVLAGAGAAVTLSRGEGALYAYFAGVGAGYVPVQLYEMGWFLTFGRAKP